MSSNLLYCLILFATLGCGLIAGIFFAFSNFVMRALARLPDSQGIAAMQAINVTVLNPLFLGTFMGTALLCAVLAGYGVLHLSQPGSGWLIAGGVLYLVGNLLVTGSRNIPRNNALARLPVGMLGTTCARPRR